MSKHVDYTKDAIKRSITPAAQTVWEEGKKQAESAFWKRVTTFIAAALTAVVVKFWGAIQAYWYLFAALYPPAALAIYVISGLLALAFIVYRIVPYIKKRVNAYKEGSMIREAILDEIEKHDNANPDNALMIYFKQLAADRYRNVIRDKDEKLDEFFKASAKPLGLDPKELLEIDSNDDYYELIKMFLHHVNRLYFDIDQQARIDSFFSEEDSEVFLNLVGDLHLKKDKGSYQIPKKLDRLFSIEGIENEDLENRAERLNWYKRMTLHRDSLPLVDGETDDALTGKQLLLLVKTALNELHVAKAIKEGNISKVLKAENSGITADQIERALAYKKALFDETEESREKILGRVFFKQEEPLDQNELEFICGVMDQVHRGRMHWYKKNDREGFDKYGYVELINNFQPKSFFVGDSLAVYVNMIQCIDKLLPLHKKLNVHFQKHHSETAEHIPHKQCQAGNETSVPTPRANVYEGDDEDSEGYRP